MNAEHSTAISCDAANRLADQQLTQTPLTAEEENAFHQHLNECDQCVSLHRVIAALPALAADSVPDPAPQIRAIMNRRRQEKQQREKLLNRALLVAVAAAVLLLSGVWIFSLNKPDPATSGVAQTGAFRCPSPTSTQLVEGVYMAYCDQQLPSAIIKKGHVQVTLHAGAVALFVDPERKQKNTVSVTTPDGEVRVKGTRFAVYYENSAAHLEVYRGIVEVIPADNKYPVTVSRQSGAMLKRGQVYPLATPVTQPLMALLDNTAINKSASIQDVDKNVDKDVDNDESPTGSVLDKAIIPASRAVVQRRRRSAGASSAPTMKELIGNARQCLISRDWQCAASAYNTVLESHGDSPSANAVRISLAKLELRHLNAPTKALRRYTTYLKNTPNGPLAAEALLGVAKCYRRFGNLAAEKDTLNKLIERFPDGALSTKATIRLQEINPDATR